jgi:hypothetical protein
MTETIILNDIPFEPEFDKIAEVLHVREGTSLAAELRELIQEAQGIAKPKAMYRLVGIDERLDSGVVLDGQRFESRVMRVNLDKINRAFLYVATCGRELYNWKTAIDDTMRKFCADMVNAAALTAAREALQAQLIGVRLLDSMLMLPSQTVSGLLFETESDYVNCQLCPREHCPNRRAPFDVGLLQEKYAST